MLFCLAGCQPVPAAVETMPLTPSPAPAAVLTPVSGAVPPRDDPTPAEPLPETIGRPPATASTGQAVQAMTQAAQRIVARFLKVQASDVVVRGIKAVVWPDSGLGCGPTERRPVSTPGYLAMVEAAGQVYEVHMAENGRGIICPKPAQK